MNWRRFVSTAIASTTLAVVVVLGAAGGAAAQERSSPLIAIDPGHSTLDVGATAVVDGKQLTEHELTLEIARETARLLELSGYRVLLTRDGSSPVNRGKDTTGDGVVDLADDLQARIDAANQAEANVLISIHFNAAPNARLRGPEAYYAPSRPFGADNRRLAQSVLNAVETRLRQVGAEVPSRGVRPDSELGGGHLFLLGPRGGRIARPSEMPAALVEGLFLTNPDDAALVARPSVRQALAAAYAEGVAAYVGAPAEQASGQATVSGAGGAYLRPAPLLATTPLTLLPAGATVALEEKAIGDTVRGLADWWRVDWQGKAGYVFGRLLSTLPTPQAPPEPKPQTPSEPKPDDQAAASGVGRATVRPSDLPIRLRREATTESPIVARVRPGDQLELIESTAGEAVEAQSDRWLRVRREGIEGWVWAPLVEIEQATVRSDDGLPARIRQEPSLQAPIVARARPGEAVAVLAEAKGEPVDGKTDRWLQVRRGDFVGWIWGPLLGA